MFRYGVDYPYLFVKLNGVKDPVKCVVRGVADHSLLTEMPHSVIVQTVNYGFQTVPVSSLATDPEEFNISAETPALTLLNNMPGAEVIVVGLSDAGGYTLCKVVSSISFRGIDYFVVAPIVQLRKSLCYLAHKSDVKSLGHLCDRKIDSRLDVSEYLYKDSVYFCIGFAQEDNFILLHSGLGDIVIAPRSSVLRL